MFHFFINFLHQIFSDDWRLPASSTFVRLSLKALTGFRAVPLPLMFSPLTPLISRWISAAFLYSNKTNHSACFTVGGILCWQRHFKYSQTNGNKVECFCSSVSFLTERFSYSAFWPKFWRAFSVALWESLKNYFLEKDTEKRIIKRRIYKDGWLSNKYTL